MVLLGDSDGGVRSPAEDLTALGFDEGTVIEDEGEIGNLQVVASYHSSPSPNQE